MEQQTKDKLVINLANSWKMASNYVSVASGAMFCVYLALPADTQLAIVQHLPVPPWAIPVITSILNVVARLWPQKSITPFVAAAKSDSTPESKP